MKQQHTQMMINKDTIKEAIIETEKLKRNEKVAFVWHKNTIDYLVLQSSDYLPDAVMFIRPKDRYTINYVYNYMMSKKQ